MADNDWQSQAIPVGSSLGDSGTSDNIRVMSEWMPGEPRTHATQFGPEGNPLQYGVSAAVSPNLAEGHALHEPFEVYKNDQLIGRYNYDDASYYSPGNPTYNSIERYGLPDLGSGYRIKWLGKDADSNDWRSQAVPVDQSRAQDWRDQAIRVEQPKVSDWQGQAKLASNHPIAVQNGWTLGQSLLNIWDTTKLKLATNAYATATQRAKDPVPDQIVQQQIDAINASPYLSPEQKQANLKAIQDGQAQEKTAAQAEVSTKQKEISDIQASLKKNNVQPWESVVGGVGPYLTGGLMGPLGPIQAAQQASAETYGETLDSSTKRLKELHPDWDDGKIVTQALKAASEASRGGGATGLALGVVDVPAAGPWIVKIAQKIGYGAATMEIANSLAEVQKNMAIKKDVDPQQDWLGQLRNIWFHIQNVATGGAFGGLHGLGGELGRPSHVPIEDRVPISEVPDTTEEVPKAEESEQPEKIKAAAVKQGDVIGVGPTHFEAIDDLNAKGGKLTDEEVDKYYSEGKPTGADYGFVTNTGRFVSREEAQKIGGITDAFQAGGEGIQEPVTGTDPWLSSIANRYVEPRVEAGEIGAVAPGKGTTPQAEIARGTAMGPEQIAQHVSDLMQDKGNFRDHAAAVRAEEARLSQQSARLSRIAEASPDDPIAQRNAEDAFKYLTDFHNGPVAKLKNQWHSAGEAMQGQVEVDLGSFSGLREQWLRDVGKEPSKDVQAKMRETARKVREAQAAEQNAMKTLSDEIEKQTARRKLPTEDQVRKNILARMNGDNPCGL